FFFSSRRRHTRSKRDWSSDVCSSDLKEGRSRYLRLLHLILPACVSIGEAKNVSNRAGDRGAEGVPVPVLFLPEAGERVPAHHFRSEERRVGKGRGWKRGR